MKLDVAANLAGLSLWVVCAVAGLAVAPASVAQPPAGAVGISEPNGNLSAEQIEADRKAVESDAALDDTQRQKALELYDQVKRGFQQANETRARVAQLDALIREAPQRIEAIRSGRAEPSGEMPDLGSVVAGGSLEQVELVLAQEELYLQQAREAQRTHRDELANLLVGSKGLSEEIALRTSTLEQIDRDLRTPAANDPPSLTRAHTQVLNARRMLRQSELDLLNLRLGNHELLTNLAQAERDLAAVEIAERQTRIHTLTEVVRRLREGRAREAREAAEDLKARTEKLPASLQTVAQENASYRRELEQLVNREQSISNALQETRRSLEETKSEYERTRQRVNVVGASRAIGKMLKRQREDLPSPRSYRRTSAERADEISRAVDRQIEIDELLRERGDIRVATFRVLEALPELERAGFEAEAENLTRSRRDALNELQTVSGRYIGQITSLDLAERQLVEVSHAFIDFIDDRLIWIPGPGITALVDPKEYGDAMVWLASPGHWVEMVYDAEALVLKRPLAVTLMLGLFSLLLAKRTWAAEQIRIIAGQTRKIRTDSFRLTLAALLLTLVVIGAWPLLLAGTGWLLGGLPTAGAFTVPISNGLLKAGIIWGSIRFLIEICLAEGVGDRHLRWPQPVREALVRELGWFLPVAVPLGFLVASTSGNDPPASAQTLGRLAFIVVMAVSTVLVFRLMRRRGPVMKVTESGNGGGPLAQLHFLWFPVLIILPVALGITSAVGYHSTSLYLEERAEQTFWFFVVLFLVKELLLRSLYVAERRLRYEDALRRRDELRAQRALGEGAKEEEAPLVSLDIPELDFDGLNEQNKRLVRAGFLLGAVIGVWVIWSELLPALGFLNTTELPMHATRIVDGIAKDVPVTLGDLTVGLVIVLVTVLAAKNIPGTLEIALLQRLPLDPGARYAITSLSRYSIAGIGVFAAFSTIGLQWSSIQWLVAALSVGLGFGLQEIVANFISGIILLFERPIRVGDVVTIDTTTGVVSRIRIRATTITNYDRQELLIPNKEFITGRVINWTLSDKTNRIIITVGVAYGSDVQKAMDLMLEAAAENTNVLDDPKPVVSFEAFGDNALSLLLRSYLGSVEHRLETITALHVAINRKFAAAGIDISFPQRDVHLNADKPLDIRLHRGPRG